MLAAVHSAKRLVSTRHELNKCLGTLEARHLISGRMVAANRKVHFSRAFHQIVAGLEDIPAQLHRNLAVNKWVRLVDFQDLRV